MSHKMIKLELKSFYFFGWELELFREIGFEFIKPKGFGKKPYKVYRISENPAPIKSTEMREKLIEELKYRMNAIKFEEDKEAS